MTRHGKWALAFTVLAAANLAAFRLTPRLTGIDAATISNTPDLQFGGYSVTDLASWLTALGQSGRAAFLNWHTFALDLTLPLLAFLAFGLAMRTALARFPRTAELSTAIVTVLCFAAPGAYMIADYAENAVVAALLSDPSRLTAFTASLATGLTVTKFAFVALSLVLLCCVWLPALLQNKQRGDAR
jgi:hypothetical protein